MTDSEETPRSKDEARRRYGEGQRRSPNPTPGSDDWQSLIEQQIAKLDLDNLPGKGKPLNLSSNPYADPADEMAGRLLKNAGYTLPWIDEGRRIDARLEKARRELARAQEEYLELRDAQICAGHQWVEGQWHAAVREFRSQIEQINREIRDYNLQVPNATLQKFSIKIDDELARMGIDA